MRNLTNNQKKIILKNSNRIGTTVFFGNHEAKILSITQEMFNEVFLKLSYNTPNGIQITELNTDLVSIK